MSITSVNNAANMLDEDFPGWENKIDLSRLSMMNSTWCVLGQLTGNFESPQGVEFRVKFYLRYPGARPEGIFATHKGAWENEILRRREASQAPQDAPASASTHTVTGLEITPDRYALLSDTINAAISDLRNSTRDSSLLLRMVVNGTIADLDSLLVDITTARIPQEN